jgi:hypothetical protein
MTAIARLEVMLPLGPRIVPILGLVVVTTAMLSMQIAMAHHFRTTAGTG